MSEDIEFNLSIPVHIWRRLVAMAAEDVRREDEFILWLIYQEDQRREKSAKKKYGYRERL